MLLLGKDLPRAGTAGMAVTGDGYEKDRECSLQGTERASGPHHTYTCLCFCGWSGVVMRGILNDSVEEKELSPVLWETAMEADLSTRTKTSKREADEE